MGDKKKIKAEAIVDLDQAIQYLRQLTARLEERKVAIQSRGEAIALEIPDLVELEVEVEQKEGKTEISVELEWKEGMKAGQAIDLTISSPDDPEVAQCLRTELAAQSQPSCAEE